MPEVGRQVCRYLQTDVLLQPAVYKTGDKYRITLDGYDLKEDDSHMFRTITISGINPIELLTSLAEKTLAGFNENRQEIATHIQNVSQFTTRNKKTLEEVFYRAC